MHELTEKHGKNLVEKWIAYIEALFIPERVRRLHNLLLRTTQNPLHNQLKSGAYLLLLRESLAGDDIGQHELRFLLFALIGELALLETEDAKKAAAGEDDSDSE